MATQEEPSQTRLQQDRLQHDRLQRVGGLIQAALALPASARAGWLAALAPADRELRGELEAFLARAAQAEAPGEAATLDGPAATPSHAPTASPAAPESSPRSHLPGAQLGPFRLLHPIGAGGMGQVWLAEQGAPVRRKVAIKVIKDGMASESVVARFDSERQALALMDHPAIAKVLDAGATPEGRPYFAMEYVEGVPIDRYCASAGLGIAARLELFVQVCEGVQHAHQKAIIHRDLKPSNVLVGDAGGRPQAKIIDFGIAKAMDRPLADHALSTEIGAVIGTPEYMSPEQAALTDEGIDTRTDVYALGVILYELLTGALPFGARGKGVGADELRRRILEDDPPRPSSRLPDGRALRGDLDAVVLKALEKDRRRRYGSASELAADLARALRHEPVQAVPPSAGYRVGKFIRRHRAGVATAAAFVLVLLGTTAVSVRQTLRADREAAASKAVNEFLERDLLAQASASNQGGPAEQPDRDLKVRTALERAAERIAGRFDRQPEIEAAIRDTIGRAYLDLGEYAKAEPQLEQALELDRRTLGPSHPKTIDALSQLAALARQGGRFPQSEALYDQAMVLARAALGPEHPGTLAIQHGLAALYDRQGRYPEAEALHEKVLAARRRVLGREHAETLESMNALAAVADMEGKYPQSAALYRETLEIRRRRLGPEHPATLWSMNELAWVLAEQSQLDEAKALYGRVLEAYRRVLGPDHPSVLSALNGLAGIQSAEGDWTAAKAGWTEALAISRRALGDEHPTTPTLLNNLATACSALGEDAQADVYDAEALATRRRVLGPEHPDTIASLYNVAAHEERRGHFAQAEAQAAAVVELRKRLLGPEHPDTLDATFLLTSARGHQGRLAEAEAAGRALLDTQRRTLGEQHQGTLRTLAALARLSFLQGRSAAAADLGAQALAGLRGSLGADKPETIDAAAVLALYLEDLGRLAEGEVLAQEAVTFDRQRRPEAWQRFFAESLLGAILSDAGKHAAAEPLLLAGAEGLLARRDKLGASDQLALQKAVGWLAREYEASGRPEKAAAWRRRLPR